MPASSGFTVAQPSWPFGGSGSLMFTSRSGASGPESKPGAFEPTVRAPRYLGALRKYSSARVVMRAAYPLGFPRPCPYVGTEFHYLDTAPGHGLPTRGQPTTAPPETDATTAHQRTAGFGKRTLGIDRDISHGSIGQRRRFACRYSAESGDTATGFPTARSNGRSLYESAYA